MISRKLPVRPSIKLLQKDTISISNVAQIHEAPINVSDITNFLIPEELVIIVVVLSVQWVVFTWSILLLGFILNYLLSRSLKIVSLLLYLLVSLMIPGINKIITIDIQEISCKAMDASTFHRPRVSFLGGIATLEA